MLDSTVPKFDATTLVAMGRVSSIKPSPCATWAAVAVGRVGEKGEKYIHDLWRISMTEPGAAPTRLTDGESNDTAPCFRADGALGFLSNRKTEEEEEEDKPLQQIWILTADDAPPYRLTNEPLGVDAFQFAAAADRLVFRCSRLPDVPESEQRTASQVRGKSTTSAHHYRTMPVRFWDRWLGPAIPALYTADGNGQDAQLLTPNADLRSLMEGQFQLTRDGRYLATLWKRTGTDRVPDALIRLFDLTTGSSRLLGDTPRIGHEHIQFSPDGKLLACARHERHDDVLRPVELVIYDTTSGQPQTIDREWIDWPEPIGWTEDSQSVLIRMQINARADLLRVSLDGQELEPVLQQDGCHKGMSVRDDWVVGLHDSLLRPTAPFVARLGRRTHRQRTELLHRAPTHVDQIATWTELTVNGAGGTPVQSFVIRPATQGPHPVLFWVHGGPISHWGDWWHWRWNPLVFVALGYAVVLPNPRGSRGFGHDFIAGIWSNQWGAACFEDLMCVADALDDVPDLDTTRMGAMGASFGGYMMNWFGGHTDRFKAIISHAGIFDMSAFYGTTDLPAWWKLQMAGNPYTDPDKHDRFSPHRFVSNWKTPTLIIHGEKDYRCPIGDGLAMFEALQLHDVPSELLVFPDENHWIQRPANVIAWHDAIIDFLNRYL